MDQTISWWITVILLLKMSTSCFWNALHTISVQHRANSISVTTLLLISSCETWCLPRARAAIPLSRLSYSRWILYLLCIFLPGYLLWFCNLSFHFSEVSHAEPAYIGPHQDHSFHSHKIQILNKILEAKMNFLYRLQNGTIFYQHIIHTFLLSHFHA